MYRLHCFSISGNCFKVAFMLRHLGQPFDTVLIDFLGGVTRDASWRRETNEMGEAPILEVDGQRLTQSGMILSWLADKHGRLGGRTPDERYEVLRWLLFDNHKFTSYFATYRFLRSFSPVAPDLAVLDWLKGRAHAAFGIVDQHLATRDYLVGDAPTIADLSLSAYLFYPEEESGLGMLTRYTHIARWIERLRTLDGWADPYTVMPGTRPPLRGHGT